MYKNKQMKNKEEIIPGTKFNRLKVIKEVPYRIVPSGVKNRRVKCVCDCGKITESVWIGVKTGRIKSCGCLQRERAKVHATTHGMATNNFYKRFFSMKARCENPNNSHYYRYGYRGICVEWKSFDDFKRDMYDSYVEHKNNGEGRTTLDRIDNDGNYCKKNCRWTNDITQSRNRSDNVVLTLKGEKKTVAEWSEDLEIPSQTIYARVNLGWKVERILSKKKWRGSNNGKIYEI